MYHALFRTRYILFFLNQVYFNIEPPRHLDSVKTQVLDLNIGQISPVSVDISIKTTWGIMQKNIVKVLPVACENGKLLGTITLSEITGN